MGVGGVGWGWGGGVWWVRGLGFGKSVLKGIGVADSHSKGRNGKICMNLQCLLLPNMEMHYTSLLTSDRCQRYITM